MEDNLDQREALADANLLPRLTRGTGRSYRMMQEAIRMAAHGCFCLILVDNRATMLDLNWLIPYDLSRYVTVRCIDSHKDIDWEHWSVPGWENHSLFVDHAVIQKRFANLIHMLNY